MVKIELRQDEWFDAGQDAEKGSFPYAAYQDKQELRKKLLELNKKNLSINDLEETLASITDYNIGGKPIFEGAPYLQEKNIWIKTDSPPGEAHLGIVKE